MIKKEYEVQSIMPQLILLKGGYKAKPDYEKLYLNAFIRKLYEFAENQENQDKPIIKQVIFYGVKYLSLVDSDKATRGFLGNRIQSSFVIKDLIAMLTPNELIQIFPVTKEYNGAKWGSKDYFYTMNKLQEHGLDKPIGEAIEKILWDYINSDIMEFTVSTLSVASKLRQFDGQKGIAEEFAEHYGIPTYRMYKDQKGKEYLVNSDTGKACRVTRFKTC